MSTDSGNHNRINQPDFDDDDHHHHHSSKRTLTFPTLLQAALALPDDQDLEANHNHDEEPTMKNREKNNQGIAKAVHSEDDDTKCSPLPLRLPSWMHGKPRQEQSRSSSSQHSSKDDSASTVPNSKRSNERPSNNNADTVGAKFRTNKNKNCMVFQVPRCGFVPPSSASQGQPSQTVRTTKKPLGVQQQQQSPNRHKNVCLGRYHGERHFGETKTGEVHVNFWEKNSLPHDKDQTQLSHGSNEDTSTAADSRWMGNNHHQHCHNVKLHNHSDSECGSRDEMPARVIFFSCSSCSPPPAPPLTPKGKNAKATTNIVHPIVTTVCRDDSLYFNHASARANESSIHRRIQGRHGPRGRRFSWPVLICLILACPFLILIGHLGGGGGDSSFPLNEKNDSNKNNIEDESVWAYSNGTIFPSSVPTTLAPTALEEHGDPVNTTTTHGDADSVADDTTPAPSSATPCPSSSPTVMLPSEDVTLSPLPPEQVVDFSQASLSLSSTWLMDDYRVHVSKSNRNKNNGGDMDDIIEAINPIIVYVRLPEMGHVVQRNSPDANEQEASITNTPVTMQLYRMTSSYIGVGTICSSVLEDTKSNTTLEYEYDKGSSGNLKGLIPVALSWVDTTLALCLNDTVVAISCHFIQYVDGTHEEEEETSDDDLHDTQVIHLGSTEDHEDNNNGDTFLRLLPIRPQVTTTVIFGWNSLFRQVDSVDHLHAVSNHVVNNPPTPSTSVAIVSSEKNDNDAYNQEGSFMFAFQRRAWQILKSPPKEGDGCNRQDLDDQVLSRQKQPGNFPVTMVTIPQRAFWDADDDVLPTWYLCVQNRVTRAYQVVWQNGTN